ncbi:nicotinate-nicotinamide nucleotide adenylyltransferase [Candidatus Saccharibacteria bacterium]|nr:MAG: nicotinate-nicotinamide nucleotide adenylyltransferase [Candidatus Saccharibacteria bacterium]
MKNEVKTTSFKKPSQVKNRIGIYSGTFDPVHAGHIAFALQAAQMARLDKVVFAPERSPQDKHHVTHFAHRVAMIRRAIRPYRQLDVLELEDKTFSVLRTLPRLERAFPGSQLIFLCGSDVVAHMASWAHVEGFLTRVELCIGRRHSETNQHVKQAVNRLPVVPLAVIQFESYAATVSSSQVRAAIREQRGVRGLLASVRTYAQREWLYL